MLISALMIGFSSAYAFAATPVWLLRAKAGIAAAMMAANIVFEPVSAAYGEALANVIDPIGIVETVQDYSWDRYIDQSVIVVRPNKVTIDGVEYSEIWLGSSAANALRASGFDFTTAYNLIANQGTPVSYATGLGEVEGVPIYEVNGTRRSQTYNIAVGSSHSDTLYNSIGNWYVQTFHEYSPASTTYGGRANTTGSFGNSWTTLNTGTGSPEPDQAYLKMDTRYNPRRYYWHSVQANKDFGSYSTDFVSDPFEFDYTSGDIDAEPIEPEEGLLLRVPSVYNDGNPDSPYNYNIPEYVNTYPDSNNRNGRELVFDPTLNPDFDIDLDMGNALGDLITAVILAKLADLLGNDTDVIYAPMPDDDSPIEPGIIDPLPDPDPAPDDPTPGTTIADTDWTLLDELLRWIQSTIDSIRHITEALQTMLDSIIEGINDILDSIRELADKILEDIELGPAKLFDKALDILKTLFLPLLLPIRAMMNLWHYVVEWIGSITTPFTWIFGIMSGTSGNMVLPIYALLAGGICISIYKALGR